MVWPISVFCMCSARGAVVVAMTISILSTAPLFAFFKRTDRNLRNKLRKNGVRLSILVFYEHGLFCWEIPERPLCLWQIGTEVFHKVDWMLCYRLKLAQTDWAVLYRLVLTRE